MKPRIFLLPLTTILCISGVYAKVDSVQTPSVVKGCTNATFSWTGGVSPFMLEFMSFVNDTFSYHIVFQNVTGNSLTTKLNFPTGWAIRSYVSDLINTADNEFFFDNFNITGSGDQSCFVSVFTPNGSAPTPSSGSTGFTSIPNRVPQCEAQTIKWSGDSESFIIDAVDSGLDFTTGIQFRGVVGQQAMVKLPFAEGTQYTWSLLPADSSQILSSNALIIGSGGNDTSCLLRDVPSPSSSTASSSSSTSSHTSAGDPGQVSTPPKNSNTVPIAIGAVLGVLGLAALVGCIFYVRHRRYKRLRIYSTDLLEIDQQPHNGIVDPLSFNDIAIVEPLILDGDMHITTTQNTKRTGSRLVATFAMTNLSGSKAEASHSMTLEQSTSGHGSENVSSGSGQSASRPVYHSDGGPVEEFPPAYGDFRRPAS